MLNEYKDKYVKVLISSRSGVGITGNAYNTYNSMITLFGTLKKSDDKFVKFENTTLLYYPGIGTSLDHTGIATIDNVKQPLAFENKTTLVNIDDIIAVSIVE